MITIRTRADSKSEVQLIVEDTGIGMDETTRQRLFEPFFTTKMDVGTGLGLSTIYGTVTRWGGSIDVRSTPGEGAVFTIKLPAWDGAIPEKDEPTSRALSARRSRILIVEDDDQVGDLLTACLRPDHELEWVRNGSEALGQVESDVALIDLGLPDVAGDEIARRLKQSHPSMVTVMITGWQLAADDPRRRLFDYHLQKPFSVNGLKEVVARAVELRDQRLKQQS